MTVAHLNWIDFPASDPSTGDINEWVLEDSERGVLM